MQVVAGLNYRSRQSKDSTGKRDLGHHVDNLPIIFIFLFFIFSWLLSSVSLWIKSSFLL